MSEKVAVSIVISKFKLLSVFWKREPITKGISKMGVSYVVHDKVFPSFPIGSWWSFKVQPYTIITLTSISKSIVVVLVYHKTVMGSDVREGDGFHIYLTQVNLCELFLGQGLHSYLHNEFVLDALKIWKPLSFFGTLPGNILM